MSPTIQSNLVPDLDREFLERLQDLNPPRSGDWQITLKDRPEEDAWDVFIEGPRGFRWAKRFEGAERDMDLVIPAIRTAVEQPANDLTAALAELAKAHIAFTAEEEPDGEVVYVIDRIRLKEEELVQLKNTGALTPEGIRQYLVDRAA